MLKRQDSFLSSSTHLENTPPPTQNRHAKPVGCFPAIFRFISKYQNRKKLLTFGKKSSRNAVSTQTEARFLQESTEADTQQDLKKVDDIDGDQNVESKRVLSLNDATPRSPMLRPEIRVSKHPQVVGSLENDTTPRALVARLMGLDEQPKNQQPAATPGGDNNKVVVVEKDLTIPNEDKRRRLLEALEKCNEDLEWLKKIIMAVQLGDEKYSKKSVAPATRLEIFKPRPISGADDDHDDGGDNFGCSTRSRHKCIKLHRNGVIMAQQQRKKHSGKKLREEDDEVIENIHDLFDKVQTESYVIKMKHKDATPSNWSSKTLTESVNQVCSDILWGEKREQRNLEMALDNYIYKDLIEEFIFELGFPQKTHRLPFEACRRRISF